MLLAAGLPAGLPASLPACLLVGGDGARGCFFPAAANALSVTGDELLAADAVGEIDLACAGTRAELRSSETDMVSVVEFSCQSVERPTCTKKGTAH